MRKMNYTALLPSVRVEQELRDRVQDCAVTARCDIADIIRDCLLAVLPTIEVQLGLVKVEPAELAEIMEQAGYEPKVEDRSAGCFGA